MRITGVLRVWVTRLQNLAAEITVHVLAALLRIGIIAIGERVRGSRYSFSRIIIYASAPAFLMIFTRDAHTSVLRYFKSIHLSNNCSKCRVINCIHLFFSSLYEINVIRFCIAYYSLSLLHIYILGY